MKNLKVYILREYINNSEDYNEAVVKGYTLDVQFAKTWENLASWDRFYEEVKEIKNDET